MTGLAASLIARIIKQRDLVRAMDEHCQTISARVTSRDQNVSIEVDGLGTMTALTLGPNAHKLGPEKLAELIVQTAHAAAQVAAQRQNHLTQEFTNRMHELQQTPLTRSCGTAFKPERP